MLGLQAIEGGPFNTQLREQLSQVTATGAAVRAVKELGSDSRYNSSIDKTRLSPQVGRPVQQRSGDPQFPDTIPPEVGTYRVKLGNGEATLKLSDSQQQELFSQAVQYQKQLVSEKRASSWATFAMAAISGLSAIAIGVTLAQGIRGKKNSNILDV